jgi:trimethylamine--corrinoid protein Co-methyltransferase
VDDEQLALDVIHAVGPGGHFLAQKHTRRHMRDLWLPRFMDRRPYEVWAAAGDGPRSWAADEARRILAEHKPAVLEPRLAAELDRLADSPLLAA